MMKIVIAAAILISSAAASAASNGQAISKSNGAAAPKTLYCFKVERNGSYIVSKICETESQWDAEGVRVPSK